MPFEPLRRDDTFAGEYRIVDKLAEGGMGVVYRAEQMSTGQMRALKVLRPMMTGDPRMEERFVQEAQVGARIASEHVVQVIAAGVDAERDMPWMAMELLDGKNLFEVVSERGALPAHEVLAITRQLCHALAAAHHAGVVHRDLKPENIVLATARRSDVAFTVKVLDFGIAKIMAENRSQITATSVVGSPLWMAPEQFDTGGAIGPPTDVWALGLIVFYLLTGVYFWRSANEPSVSIHRLMAEMVTGNVPPSSQRARELNRAGCVPEGFDAWFAKCTRNALSERFADAGAAMVALESAMGGVLAKGPAPSNFDALSHAPTWVAGTGTQPKRPRAVRHVVWAVIALAAVGGVAVGVRLMKSTTRVPSQPHAVVMDHGPDVGASVSTSLPFDAGRRVAVLNAGLVATDVVTPRVDVQTLVAAPVDASTRHALAPAPALLPCEGHWTGASDDHAVGLAADFSQ